MKSKIGAFIEKANTLHGEFDYSKVEYINVDTKVCIICSVHGEFWQTPYHHINRQQGCPQCKGRKIANKKSFSVEEFVAKSKEIHNSKYDYSLVEYKNAHFKVKIICPNHGPFMITPNNHIYGVRGKGGKVGCPACSNNVSHAGQEWLDSFKNPNIEREVTHYIENRRFKFDGYDRTTNTVYEYFGSFWHGNPDKYKFEDVNPRTHTTFGELYKATLIKIGMIKVAGFNIVYVWGL